MSFSASPTYLLSRPSGLYFRIRVPRKIRPSLQRTEYRLALRTGCLRDARFHAMKLAATAHELFQWAAEVITNRQGTITMTNKKTNPTKLTDERIRDIVDRNLKEAFKDTYERRMAPRERPLTEEQYDDLQEQAEVYDLVESDYRQDRALHDYRRVAPHARTLLEEEGINCEEQSTQFNKLCDALLASSIHFLKEVRKPDFGHNYVWSPDGNPVLAPKKAEAPATVVVTAPKEKTKVTPSPAVRDAVEEYITAKKDDWSKSSQTDIPQNLRQFVEILEYSRSKTKSKTSVTLRDLNKDTMKEYARILRLLPTRLGKQASLSISEQLAMKAPEERRLSPKTLATRFTNVSTFLNWCETEEYLANTKTLRARLVLTKAEKKTMEKQSRRAFTDDELRAIFLYEKYGVQGKPQKPSHFWLPLLGLFTGARIEELSQLDLTDIRQSEAEKLWYFDINDLGEEKNVKTSAAKRQVPLHPFLLEDLDFIGYVNRLKEIPGVTRLFPDLTPDEKGKFSASASKWFTRFRRECGVGGMKGQHSTVGFHSFRHTFITRCKHLKLDRNIYKDVVGHENHDDITEVYEGSHTVETTYAEIISKVDFHERLGLDVLKNNPWTDHEHAEVQVRKALQQQAMPKRRSRRASKMEPRKKW